MKYRPEIDGLRAFSVFPVILFHAGFNLFSGGYIGVDIFFVISGYLITSIIIDSLKNNSFSLVQFYERRARRILPALLTVMFVTLPLALMSLTPYEMVNYSRSLIYVTTYISNFLFMKLNNYFDSSSELNPLLHTWSLSVEEQYYFVFPLFMIFIFKNHFVRIKVIYFLIALVSIIFASVLSQFKPSISFYMLPTRAWELLAGALVAKYLSDLGNNQVRIGYSNKNLLSLIGLFLIIFSIFMFDHDTPTPSYYTLIPVSGAALVILYADNDSFVGAVLSQKLVVFFGLLSYSMYLWHQPIFAFARIMLPQSVSQSMMIGFIILTVALSYLTWRYIEGPFRNSSIIHDRKFYYSIFGASIIFIVLGVSGIYSGGFPSRFLNLNPIQTRNTEHLQKVDQCFLLSKSSDQFVSDMCDPRQNAKKILLVGDSHAASLYPGLSEYLSSKNIDIVMMTAAFCLPLVQNFPPNKSKAATKRCETINRQVMKNIETNSYDLIVVSSYIHHWAFSEDWSWTYPAYYLDYLYQIKMLASRNKVLVVGQFAVWTAGLNQTIYKEAVDLRIKDYKDFAQYSSNGLDSKIFDTDKKLSNDIRNLNAGYVSILDKICDHKQCARYIKTGDSIKLMTFDYGHLGLEASQFIGSNIVGPEIVRLIY